MNKNHKKFKLVVKKGVTFLEAENETIRLDDYHQGIEQQVRKLLSDDASMAAFYDEFQVLWNQLGQITAMKEEVKPLLKQLYDFIHDYSHLYKTKEYKQVKDKLRHELDRAFDIPKC